MDNRYKKFYIVAKLKSFSAAAETLGISQPGITLAISSLERTLGVKLFERKRYNVELTEEGKLVFASASKIFREDNLLHSKLDNLYEDESRHIGIIDSIAYLLYSSTRKSDSLADLEIMVDNSKKIINDIIADNIDVGLITGQPGKLTKDIKVSKLHNEKFVFVCSPEHSASNRAKVIDDWLAFNIESTTYSHFTRQFKKLGLVVKPIFYSTSLNLLKDMAAAGRGTALLPYHMVRKDISAGRLVEIKAPLLTRPIWVINRKKNKSHIDDLSSQVNELLASASLKNKM